MLLFEAAYLPQEETLLIPSADGESELVRSTRACLRIGKKSTIIGLERDSITFGRVRLALINLHAP